MNGEACDYASVTDMIQQIWPGDDDYSRNIVGRLTADSGAVTELAEALDERSVTPEDAWVVFSETVGKLSADNLDSIADWLDGAEVLTGNLQATTSTETYILRYDGPDGVPGYYTVKAEQTAAGTFAVSVLAGEQAIDVVSTVVEAEEIIKFDRHRIASGHLPGTCDCFSS